MKRIFLFIILIISYNNVMTQNSQNKIDYNTAWTEVEKFESDILPKSVLSKVGEIYNSAMLHGDYEHAVKAIVHRVAAQENVRLSINEILDSLQQDVKRLPQPAKSIVYSIIGDVLTRYYNQNRWKIMQRTHTDSGDDIQTWDIARLFQEVIKYYNLSVYDEKSLQQTPFDKFEFIVDNSSNISQNLCLTLYDCLTLHAIEALGRKTAGNKPQELFVLNNPEYFADVHTFVNCEIITDDTLSSEYQVISLYQRLLKYRLQSNESPKTLIGIDLERLEYVYREGRYKDKDAQYENALKTLMNEYVDRNEWSYIAYRLAVFYCTSQEADGKFNPKKAYDLCTEIISKNSDKQIEEYAQKLRTQITNPAISLTLASAQYQCPDTPILSFVEYKNTDTLYLWFFKTDEDYMEKSLFDIKPEHFARKKPFVTQKTVLPRQNDYRKHSTEIMINSLPQGLYVMLATNSPTFQDNDNPQQIISITTLQVSSLTAVYRAGDEKLFAQKNGNGQTVINLYVVNSKSGKPVENAQIEYQSQDFTVEYYTTDSEGTVYIPSSNKARKITVIKDRDRFVIFSPNTYFYTASNRKQTQAVFFTDRSIYRPGQTIYYKVLCFTKHGERAEKLLTKTSVNVEFRDVNNNVIAQQKQTTNEYGTIQGSFTIPQNLLNGTMSLSTEYGQQYITVDEYKRPTFEVTFEPVKGAYRLNDSIHLSGFAKGLANYNIDNAKVQYRIVRNLQYRLQRLWYPPILEPSREIASGILKTDNSGKFVIDFKAEAADVKYNDMIYTYNVTADVTDANGETHSANLSVKTGNIPLLIETSIPQNIFSDNPLTFNLNTTNFNGDFVPADISVTVTALKPQNRILHSRLWSKPDTLAIPRSEFEKLFPFEPYGDENNPEKYADDKQIISYRTKTADSLKLNHLSLEALSTAPSGWYRIDIKAKNNDNIETGETKYIHLINKSNPGTLKNMNDWVITVNNSAEPGENIELLVAGGEQQSYIRYSIILNNRIIEQKNIVAGNIHKQIAIPVKEEYRGGFALQFIMVQNGRIYTASKHISVPYTNKQLDIKFTTFRDELLPGEHEKWTLTTKNKNGEKEQAEMVATLYDASLDAFTQHSWSDMYSILYKQRFSFTEWRIPYPPTYTARICKAPVSNDYIDLDERTIVAFGLSGAVAGLRAKAYTSDKKEFLVRGMSSANQNVLFENESLHEVVYFNENENENIPSHSSGLNIIPRRNFDETAFFYPQLRTDEHGEFLIEFTVPESITRWKMSGFAHTRDLKIGNITNELITRKKVMVMANAPRFFRENDSIEFTAKINNISDSDLTGQSLIQLYDAFTMQPVDTKIVQTPQTQSFSVKTNESTIVKWTLKIPAGIQAITCKVVAQAGNHSDGEEKTIPVMPNSTMVIETMPFSIRAGQQKELVFNRLKDNHSKVQRNHRLTLEFTSNPAWYAVQSIPSLMEYPYECVEQTFARFYANSLASTLVNSSPRIKQIFDTWRNIPENKEALLSNLEKNQELKQVLLEETPWVMQAQSETERKKRVSLLFDLNKMNYEQQKSFDKIVKMQLNDGGFSWFEGLPANRFITQHVLAGLEHLKKLNALNSNFANKTDNIINKGLKYLDTQVKEDYDKLRKNKDLDLKKQHIAYNHLHYLYVCSFSKHTPQNEAFKYYYSQVGTYWTNFNIYAQAITALVTNRFGDKETARKIIRSLKERSQQSDEMGMYWNDNVAGYFWYQAPIETQAMLIEAFNEVADDKQAVEEMKIWLLRNKQTNDWNTTKATTEACYALLSAGGNLLDENRIIDVRIAGKPLSEIAEEEIRPEPGSGYLKTAWNGSDISNEMATLQVNNPNSKGIAWGGMYWQYFEEFDRITSSETNLKLNKQLFLKRITTKGEELSPLDDNNLPKIGDIVVVRMELRADRDYEYVHLKDMRAASFEPIKNLSGHRYQDGLWYYENVKDASNNFFITYLRKGTYVFEYELRVTHAGEFSNGITTFQCMYAPEFNAHSGGSAKLKIEEK
jgi:uncharacterized protein YfaS (alpha-2-macroglobulin family)